LQLKTTFKKLFLIDGIGALVSALFLGLVLVHLQALIGMPKHILYGLAIAPCFFLAYSLGCHFFVKANFRPYMKFIAICNLVYCGITMCLVYCYYDALTALGLFYFVTEMIIILFLVRLEFRSAAKV